MSLMMMRQQCWGFRLQSGRAHRCFDLASYLRVGSTGYKEPNGGGQLFRFDKDGSINVMEERICCSNGLGWSPDNKTLCEWSGAL